MTETTNPWQVATQGNAGRAIATLAIAIPITLSGKDANGVEFTEKTRTIVIDRYGGKIATKYVLSLGSEMTLHNLIVGQKAKIKVVWVGERRAAEETNEIGIQFLESQNIWGIEFPSHDRQESALPTPRLKVPSPRKPAEAGSPPGQSTAPKIAVSDASSSLKPPEIGRPGPSLTPPSMQIAPPPPAPGAVETSALPVEESKELIKATLARFTQQIEAADESKARPFEKKPEELIRPFGLVTQSRLAEIAKDFEERESSLKEHVKTLEDDLQGCRTQMQQLVAELKDLKNSVQDEMGKTLREVQEGRPKMVELAMGELAAKVKEEVNSLADELIDLTQRRIQEEVASTSEPLIQGALERVYSVTEEQSAKAGEDFQGQVRRLLEEGQAQLGRMFQSTASEFGEEIHRTSATTMASAQADIATAYSKSAVGFEAQLQKTADDVVEVAAQQLQKQVEDTLLLMGEELKASGKKVTAETEERLSGVGRAAFEAVSSASDYALQEFQLRLGERAQASADNYISRLEESLAKAEGEQQKSALSSFRKALEQECAEALTRMNNALAQILQAVSEQGARQADALNDLRKAVEEESLQTLASLKGVATETLGEISGQIERETNALKDLHDAAQEESAKTLAKAKSEANQAIRGISEQVGRDLEALSELRNSLKEETDRALPKFQEDLGQVMGEVNEQVQQQVNMLCSLLNLIEKESAQVFSKVKNDVAEALAEHSRLAEQQMKSTQASLNEWETRVGSRVESQLQQLEGTARTSLEALQEQSALAEQQVKSTQASLSDWETRMDSRVEFQLQQLEEKARTSLGTLQEQSAELLTGTLEKLRGESRALPEQLGASLRKAAGEVEQDWVERIRGRQQQMAEEIIEASAAQLGMQLRQNLDLFGEQLKLKQEQAASAVAEAFRNKMVELLSVFQSPAKSDPPPAQSPSAEEPA